jgi:hypothetical protein
VFQHGSSVLGLGLHCKVNCTVCFLFGVVGAGMGVVDLGGIEMAAVVGMGAQIVDFDSIGADHFQMAVFAGERRVVGT